MYNIIAISGTPGTGKTDVARLVAKKLDANLIEINRIVMKMKCRTDRKRKTKIVDIRLLQKAVNKHIQKNNPNIIEGHLSHLLKSDFIIILRTDPKILEKRLGKRKWSKSKILENVQTEIIDEILIEVLEKYPKSRIIEINATKREPENTAKLIIRVLNNHSLQKVYSPGRIKWLKKYYRMLE